MVNNIFMIGALAVRADGTYTPFSAEAWKYAGEMTLLGMGMIFAVLALLWGILAIFKLVFVKDSKAKKVAPAPKAAEPTQEPVAAPVVQSSDDGELIAVITAAIAAYRAEEGSADIGGFRVVSFRRVRNTRK